MNMKHKPVGKKNAYICDMWTDRRDDLSICHYDLNIQHRS